MAQSAAKTEAGKSATKEQGYTRTKHDGKYGVRAKAWAELAAAGLPYYHDTMDGKSVQLRIIISNPGKITMDTFVSGWVKGDASEKIQKFFENWFSNKVRVIHLDHTGAWGQPVEVAAKVELTGMDAKNLVLYSYDKAANTYKRMEKTNYWLDKNGYLHFTTELAGDIIISDGALITK